VINIQGNFKAKLVIVFVILFGAHVIAQEKKDSAATNNQLKANKIVLLTYVRVISDSKGSVRIDENYVGNFKLINWLNLEAGLRFGEHPPNLNSYFHYKLELQTKYFWKTLRLAARMSDDVSNNPAPAYRRTNKIFLAEAKYPLSSRFMVRAGVGYLFSSQQNIPDILPTNLGKQDSYLLFKIAVRYVQKKNGFFELAYGTYDVFNPYSYNQPFAQIITEQELSHLCTFFSYFRYQYDYNVFRPYNYFFCVGVKFHLARC
jgi:uncharacterized membrane protein YkvA (DUF1232 family)